MNDQKPNPSAGGRFRLDDNGEHVPVDQQAAKGSADADKTSSAPAVKKTNKTYEVKNVAAK